MKSERDQIRYARCAAGLKQAQLAELINRVLEDEGLPPTWDGNSLSQFEAGHRTITERSWRLIRTALSDVGAEIPEKAPRVRRRKNIGKRIRAARKELGLTQQDVVDEANTILEERGFPSTWHGATMGRLEASAHQPKLSTVGLMVLVFQAFGAEMQLEDLA